jgi:hypothetical protein
MVRLLVMAVAMTCYRRSSGGRLCKEGKKEVVPIRFMDIG